MGSSGLVESGSGQARGRSSRARGPGNLLSAAGGQQILVTRGASREPMRRGYPGRSPAPSPPRPRPEADRALRASGDGTLRWYTGLSHHTRREQMWRREQGSERGWERLDVHPGRPLTGRVSIVAPEPASSPEPPCAATQTRSPPRSRHHRRMGHRRGHAPHARRSRGIWRRRRVRRWRRRRSGRPCGRSSSCRRAWFRSWTRPWR